MGLAQQMWQERIDTEEHARLLQYAQAWKAYFGQHRRALKVRPGQSDDNVIINYCRELVDKGVAFLFGQEPDFEIDETGETEAELWLSKCWKHNRKMQLLKKIALNGGVCGHCFVKIVPRDPYPRLVNISPEYVTVVTDPDDIEAVWRYRIQYPALGHNGEQLTIRQVIEQTDNGRWIILDQMATDNNPFVTRETVVWPYAWPPIVDCQNLPSPNEYYGLSDIESDVIDLNHSINFIVSNISRILRFHAHPKTWAKGCQASDLKIAIDEMIVLQSAEGEMHNLEMQSDLGSSIEFYRRLKEAMHEVTNVPEIATGKVDNIGSLSGVALQILYQPLIDKTTSKRDNYGAMLVDLCQHFLEIGGWGADGDVTIHWPELLPRDIMQERQAALLDQQLGVSKDTLLRQLGYDPDVELDKSETENGDMAETMLTAFDRDGVSEGVVRVQ